MIKIYPSSVGFAWGSLCFTETNSACWRYIQLSHSMETNIHPDYKRLGEAHEVWYSNYLTEEHQREVSFKREVKGDAVISGRCDFLLADRVDECKGTFSPTTFSMIKKGKYKLNHLAQICLYLSHYGLNNGRLVYGFYGQHNGELEQIDHHIFNITISTDRSIWVDGHKTEWSVKDIVQHVLKQSEYLTTGEIAPPPEGSKRWGGPCHWCPLKGVCESYNNHLIDEATLREAAVTLIQNQEQKPPKIKELK